MKTAILVLLTFLAVQICPAGEFHVSVRGDDGNTGTSKKPFRTISAAARVAQPGDVISVHEGVYRERVSSPIPVNFRSRPPATSTITAPDRVSGKRALS